MRFNHKLINLVGGSAWSVLSRVKGLTTETQSPQSTREDIGLLWQRVVRRRSFLKGIGMVSATLSAGPLLVTACSESESQTRLSQGDVALLKFAAWAEIVETDLWIQYAELRGVGPSGGGTAQSSEQFQGFFGGNPA